MVNLFWLLLLSSHFFSSSHIQNFTFCLQRVRERKQFNQAKYKTTSLKLQGHSANKFTSSGLHSISSPMPLGQWTTSILYVIAIYSEAKESGIEGEYTVKLINRALKLFPSALLIALLFADPFERRPQSNGPFKYPHPNTDLIFLLKWSGPLPLGFAGFKWFYYKASVDI